MWTCRRGKEKGREEDWWQWIRQHDVHAFYVKISYENGKSSWMACSLEFVCHLMLSFLFCTDVSVEIWLLPGCLGEQQGHIFLRNACEIVTFRFKQPAYIMQSSLDDASSLSSGTLLRFWTSRCLVFFNQAVRLHGWQDMCRSATSPEQRQRLRQTNKERQQVVSQAFAQWAVQTTSALIEMEQWQPLPSSEKKKLHLKLRVFLVANMRNYLTDLKPLLTTWQWNHICAFCHFSRISSTLIDNSHNCRCVFSWAFVARALVWISYRCPLPSLISWHNYISL